MNKVYLPGVFIRAFQTEIALKKAAACSRIRLRKRAGKGGELKGKDYGNVLPPIS